MTKTLAVLPGDGIGPEVMEPTVAVLQRVGDFSFDQRLIGGAAIDWCGDPLPETTKKACQQADAVLLGTVGGPKWESPDPAAPRPEEGLLGVRKIMNAYANLRPIQARSSLADVSPLKANVIEGTDFVIVRELLGGIYFGDKGKDEEGTYDTCHYTDDQIFNIGWTAFELALNRSEDNDMDRQVVSIDKANVMRTSRRWREIMSQLQKDVYSDVELVHMHVDKPSAPAIFAAPSLRISPNAFSVTITFLNCEGLLLSW